MEKHCIGNINLDLYFMGDRQYFQGANIYMAASGAIKNIFNKKAWVAHIAFRNFAKTACFLRINDLENINSDLVRATFNAKDDDRSIKGVIYETGTAVKLRLPFDENSIIQKATIKDNCITQIDRAGFSSIEEIVTCTKHLHNSLLPQTRGKWIFSQLDLFSPFSENQFVLHTVRIKQNLANRITVSNIEADGLLIGKIQFTITEI